MEAVITDQDFRIDATFKDVMATFFRANDPETTKVLFWKFFRCWVTKDCSIKSELSDKEVALFFDQLIDLVAAAYILHQANGVPKPEQGGKEHE